MISVSMAIVCVRNRVTVLNSASRGFFDVFRSNEISRWLSHENTQDFQRDIIECREVSLRNSDKNDVVAFENFKKAMRVKKR